MPETTLDIPTAGAELLSAATALADAIEQPDASTECPVALALIEQALRVLSTSVTVLAHDAVPNAPERVSREREAHLRATMHTLAQDISLIARSCARAREIVGPLVAAKR